MKDHRNRSEALLSIGRTAMQVVASSALLVAIGYVVVSNPTVFGKGRR